MTNSDEYNGWTNRETWALQLWLSNDQGLSEMTRERVADAMTAFTKPSWAKLAILRVPTAGRAVKSLVEELFDPTEELLSPETIIQILSDVGSLYRVNWDEIGAAFLPEED